MNTKKRVKELLYVTIGAFILAISINCFFQPNRIVAGGANGLSIILSYLTGINTALILYAINIPLLILCFWLLGKDVGMKTIYGSLVFPLLVGVTSHFPVVTHNQLLAAIFGGVVTGMGLGLIFRGDASTGGTAILSQIVHKYVKVPLGIAVSLVDGFVILAGFLAFDMDTILQSLIALFIIGRVIDIVQTGFSHSKNVLIISEHAPQLQQMILKKLDLGVTEVPVVGGYEQAERQMLMCVLPENRFLQLKAEILAIDEQAFIVTMAANEVEGKGFSLSRL